MLDCQQVPLGHWTVSFLEEYRRKTANSSVQCGSTWKAVCAHHSQLMHLDGVHGVIVNIQGRQCLRMCPVLPPPRHECVTMNVCVSGMECVCAPMVCECASGMQCARI